MPKQSRPYRLMTLLESLSKEEFYELGKYLRRHSGSANDKLRLYDYFRKNWIEVEEEEKPNITNELLQKRIFKKKLSNNNKINTLNSQFVKAIKDFLIEETLKTDRVTRNLLLSKILKKRGLDELFLSHSEHSMEKIKQSQTTLEAFQYDALYTLTHDVTFHRDTPKFKAKHQEWLNQTEHYLDMVYMLRKLQIMCEQTTRNSIVQSGKSASALLLDLEQDIIKTNNNKLIQIYLYIIELYSKQSFDIYQKIKTIITDTQLEISNFTRMVFVRLMINYCHKKYSEDKNTYLREICDLYYFAHQNKLLIEDRYMGEIDYLNLTKVILASENSWNEEALIGMSNSLKPEYRENGKLLAEAILRFKQKNYNEARRLLLQKIQWSSVEYKLDTYCLLIRTLYEVADYEQLKIELHSFALFIDKNKTLSEERKLPNQNFVDFVTKIAECKAASTSIDEILALDLLGQPMAYGDWCAAKLAELTA